MSLISAAVAPVVLISAVAILLSGYTSKHISISSQMRSLAMEYRNHATDEIRRQNLKVQLLIFQRRLHFMWRSIFALSLAQLCFLTTVISVILSERAERIGVIGVISLVVGLLLMFAAVVTELYEMHLSRLTVTEELADICVTKES